MPSLTLPDRLIWFAHCPKAGGTSVEQFMVSQWGEAVGHLHWGWDLWWRRGGWRVADPPNSPQHLVWDDACARLDRVPDAVFAVVRDPAARMASEHRWQRRGRRGTWVGRAVARLPFSFWLRVMLAMARRNPFAFDNHLRPQADFVPPEARVFRLEDGLGPVADWLVDVAGASSVTEPVPHALANGDAPKIAAQDRALIEAAFQEDYARFGYARSRAVARRGWVDVVAAVLAVPLVWLDRRGRL